MDLNNVARSDAGRLLKLRWALSDPSYMGPSKEDLLKQLDLKEYPTVFEINRRLEELGELSVPKDPVYIEQAAATA